ncbi:RNA-directed DNA polymerase, eukaryota, reverse transcriptase zinc-binding domain protein, partial [Tanacetum coccineum]
ALKVHKGLVKDRPWTILGDFNAMFEFRDCVTDIDVEDIAMTGLNFTWNKKPGKEGGLLKKLDRILGNVHFMSAFPLSFAQFLPYMLSDHTPTVLVMPIISNVKPKPFKFHNYLTAKVDFIPVVRNVWSNKVNGFSMFSLVSKLKMLKKPLRKLNFEQGNLFDNVKRLKTELAAVQSSMTADPHNNSLREEELRVLKAYRAALKEEELFLRQKAKVEWLEVGDRNSKYFHNVVKGRRNRNRISYIEDLNGNPFHGNNVGDQFVSHFKNVLGRSSSVLPFNDPDSLFVKKLPV